MNYRAFRGVAFLAVALVLAPASVLAPLLVPLALLAGGLGTFLVFHQSGAFRQVGTFRGWRRFWASELGLVVTTLYFARSGIPGGPVLINGSATPPTAIQAQQIPVLKVQMVFVTAATVGTITHNWGLDKSSPTYFDPEIWYWAQNNSDAGSGSYLPLLTFDLTNTNVVLVNKLAGVGAFASAATFLITLRNNAAMLNAAGSNS